MVREETKVITYRVEKIKRVYEFSKYQYVHLSGRKKWENHYSGVFARATLMNGQLVFFDVKTKILDGKHFNLEDLSENFHRDKKRIRIEKGLSSWR